MGRITSAIVEGISIPTGSELNVLQMLAGTGHPFSIRSIDVNMQGKDNTATSVACRLRLQTGGTGGTVVAPKFLNSALKLITPATLAWHSRTGASGTHTIASWRVHPQGSREKFWPIDHEMPEFGGAEIAGLMMQAVDDAVEADVTVYFVE